MTTVLLDTGPLVALLDQRDRYHQWATSQLAGLRQPMATCEAVLTEAGHLLRRSTAGHATVLRLLRENVLTISFNLLHEQDRLHELLLDYDDVPMSLANACLVRMSELFADSVIFTIDGDFRVYRRHRRQKLPLLIPSDV